MVNTNVDEILSFACESFKLKDYSVAKDFCLKALSGDPQNLQAKELYRYIIFHKRSNGRFSEFNILQIYNYLLTICDIKNLELRDITLHLVLFELKNIDLKYISNNDINYIKEMIDEFTNCRNKDYFGSIIKELKSDIELIEETNRNNELLYNNLQKTQYAPAEYENWQGTNYKPVKLQKEKKTLSQKLWIAFIFLLPFIIFLLPGYLIVKFITSSNKKK